MPTDVEAKLGITKTGPHTFQSNEPLSKPTPSSRGVYGGNLAGQALLVAIKSTHEPGFTPHSLHSYFVKPTSDTAKVDWAVTEISNGKNFVNRTVKARQGDQITYIANISLTKRNSHNEAQAEYDAYAARQAAKEANSPASGDDDDDDDDDEEDEREVAKPFQFQTPYPDWLKNNPLDTLTTDIRAGDRLIYHRITPEMTNLQLTSNEEKLPTTERRVSFYVKWGDGQQDQNDLVEFEDPAFQFVGLGVISDSYFLTRLGRLLRIPSLNHQYTVHYFSVSLDHVMYFHDNDFDVTKWMGFAFKAVRLVNNRVLLEAEVYNDKGVHVASIIQEGLVYFNGIEKEAKL